MKITSTAVADIQDRLGVTNVDGGNSYEYICHAAAWGTSWGQETIQKALKAAGMGLDGDFGLDNNEYQSLRAPMSDDVHGTQSIRFMLLDFIRLDLKDRKK